mmetsp:Transcript_10216/g.26538  ORF Transcript_10216/g.26538 Transcript_10216/m.26538 type:complete len:339 (+) Transcript_10216:71-1087(+)
MYTRLSCSRRCVGSLYALRLLQLRSLRECDHPASRADGERDGAGHHEGRLGRGVGVERRARGWRDGDGAEMRHILQPHQSAHDIVRDGLQVRRRDEVGLDEREEQAGHGRGPDDGERPVRAGAEEQCACHEEGASDQQAEVHQQLGREEPAGRGYAGELDDEDEAHTDQEHRRHVARISAVEVDERDAGQCKDRAVQHTGADSGGDREPVAQRLEPLAQRVCLGPAIGAATPLRGSRTCGRAEGTERDHRSGTRTRGDETGDQPRSEAADNRADDEADTPEQNRHPQDCVTVLKRGGVHYPLWCAALGAAEGAEEPDGSERRYVRRERSEPVEHATAA